MSSLLRLLAAIALPAFIFGQTQIVLQQSKYLAPGTGAVSRSGASKFAEAISIKDYGAVGNGVTDDLPAINKAFAAVSQTGQKLLFPAGTYGISGTMVVPNKTEIFGMGRGDANSVNTVIKALPGFPAGGTVVQMGSAPGPNFGVQVQNMTIDGSAIAGVCLSNTYSEELSYGRDLLLVNCGTAGLLVSSYASQNSGPFENLEIYPGNGPTVNANTVCIQVTGTIAFRGIQGVTCNGGSNYAARPAIGLALDGAGYYGHIHVEHMGTAISLGNTSLSADGMTVVNGEFGPDVATGVAITGASGINNENLTVLGMFCNGCTNLLTDGMMGTNIADVSLGYYMIGNGAGNTKPMLSSNYGVGSQVYGPAHVSGSGSFGAGNTNYGPTFSLWDARPGVGVTSGIEWAGAAQGTAHLFEWRSLNDQVMSLIAADGSFQSSQLSAISGAAGIGSAGIELANSAPMGWSSSNAWSGTPDVGLARLSAGTLQITNGGTGLGSLNLQGVQLSSTGTQPVCSATTRGTFWFVQSASGTADHFQVCSKPASNTYAWTSVF